MQRLGNQRAVCRRQRFSLPTDFLGAIPLADSDQLRSGAAFIFAPIIALMYERRRRRNAEVEARQRLLELAHMNRHATAGELSASIAHELGQPLGAVLSNAETAEVLLNSPSPNLDEIKQILTDIMTPQRAGQ